MNSTNPKNLTPPNSEDLKALGFKITFEEKAETKDIDEPIHGLCITSCDRIKEFVYTLATKEGAVGITLEKKNTEMTHIMSLGSEVYIESIGPNLLEEGPKYALRVSCNEETSLQFEDFPMSVKVETIDH
jgi:hypothetical protein